MVRGGAPRKGQFALKRARTAGGIGCGFMRFGSSGWLAAHTRVSKPSTASAPTLVSRCSSLKLDPPHSTSVVSIVTSSPYRVGWRKRARVSITGCPGEVVRFQIVDLVHAKRALDQYRGRGVEHLEIPRIKDDSGGIAVGTIRCEPCGCC